MQLEDYFDFLAPDDIRLKGTRMGIETILYDHLHRCMSPEEILHAYPSLTLEQIHATVLYYLHHKDVITAYLNDWLAWSRQARAQQRQHPPPVLARLRQRKTEQDAQGEGRGTSLSA